MGDPSRRKRVGRPAVPHDLDLGCNQFSLQSLSIRVNYDQRSAGTERVTSEVGMELIRGNLRNPWIHFSAVSFSCLSFLSWFLSYLTKRGEPRKRRKTRNKFDLAAAEGRAGYVV